MKKPKLTHHDLMWTHPPIGLVVGLLTDPDTRKRVAEVACTACGTLRRIPVARLDDTTAPPCPHCGFNPERRFQHG